MTLESCIFCQIIDGKIPTKKIHESESFICIQDIQPQAPVHLLIIPKHHTASLETAFSTKSNNSHARSGAELVGGLFEFADQVARLQGLLPGGYRSVINTGVQGGQTVFHLHLHLLGGTLSGRFA